MAAQLVLCAAPARAALPRASETAELRAAIRKYGSLRLIPFHQLMNIYLREPDEALTLTVRRSW